MIKLSKKWAYALKAVIYIWSQDKLLKISDISKDQDISETLLRRIIADLEKSSILKTIKWRWWWVCLWRDLKKISIYDILFSAWEELWISDCTKWQICNNKQNCNSTDVLWFIQKWFNSILKLYTLEKILASQIKK